MTDDGPCFDDRQLGPEVADTGPRIGDSQEFSAAVDRVDAFLQAFSQMGAPMSKDTVANVGVAGVMYPLHVADLRLMVDSAMGANPQPTDVEPTTTRQGDDG